MFLLYFYHIFIEFKIELIGFFSVLKYYKIVKHLVNPFSKLGLSHFTTLFHYKVLYTNLIMKILKGEMENEKYSYF